MLYVICGLVFFLLASKIACILLKRNLFSMETIVCEVCGAMIIMATFAIIITVDYKSQTEDKEVWSGYITTAEHREEWDEWHEGYYETEYYTDSNGESQSRQVWHDGYWEHHNAINYIKTSDDGTKYVTKTPDGKRFSDSFVNSTKELEEYYPVGSPTASIHKYENKVQCSYSMYKHSSIDLKEYKLPEYPMESNNFKVCRLVGEFDNFDKCNNALDSKNSELNNTNNPNNYNETKSYKQVNIIIVNLGDVSSDYGFALQDYWENGNKNDFVVAFGSKDNNITWCYPFSWSEREDLKNEVRNYLEGASLDGFDNTIEKIGDSVEDKFERKQFSDFGYIQTPIKEISKILMIIIVVISTVVDIYVINKYGY